MSQKMKEKRFSDHLNGNIEDLKRMEVLALKAGLNSIYIKNTKTVE